MAEPQPLQLLAPALPEYEHKDEHETTNKDEHGGTTRTLSPETTAALGGADKLLGDTESYVAEKTKSDKANAQIASDAEQEKAQTDISLELQKQAIREKHDAIIAAGEQRHKALQGELDNTPSPALFAGKSTLGKVMQGVGLALVGFTDAAKNAAMVRAGMKPDSSDPVRDLIERDLQSQRDHIANLKDKVAMARAGVADAREAKQILLSGVDQRGAEIYKRVERAAAARLAAQKVDDAGINNHPLILDARKQRLEYQLKAVEPTYKQLEDHHSNETKNTDATTNRVPGADKNANAKTTESQDNAAFLGQQMLDDLGTVAANPQLSDAALSKVQNNASRIEGAGKAGGSVLGSLAVAGAREIGALPKGKYEGLTDEEQIVANAHDNIVEKLVRKFTGAGMSAQEAQRMADQEAPGPGDSPALRQYKIERLRAAANQMMSLSGAAAAKVAPAARPPGTRPETRPPASVANPTGAPTPAQARTPPPPGATAPPEDVNSELPLPEDPNAEEAAPITKTAPAKPVAPATPPPTAPAPGPTAGPAPDARTAAVAAGRQFLRAQAALPPSKRDGAKIRAVTKRLSEMGAL